MFFGTFSHNLDNKGRMVIPSKFRHTLGESAKVYVLQGFEGCLSVYPESDFQSLLTTLQSHNYLNSTARDYLRVVYSSIVELEIDSHNRLSLPKAILDQYQIGNEVSIVGVGDHFEIWNAVTFEDYRKTTSQNLTKIGDKLTGDHRE